MHVMLEGEEEESYKPREDSWQISHFVSTDTFEDTLDGKLSFTFHKIQAYSITKGIFYPSFFIMKLFDKTTGYCQCDFEAKYLDNTDFILS